MTENPCAFLFNGDADGLISQHMLYLSGLRPTLRITGMKRDISLMQRLPQDFTGDVYAIDISLKTNAEAARAFLSRAGGKLTWFDHHESAEFPASNRLMTHIHGGRGQCTGLIVNGVLGHRFDAWAAAAAFGDNVNTSADAVLSRHAMTQSDREDLTRLGEWLNYNAYGEPQDALYAPASLAENMQGYADPLNFFRESGLFGPLEAQLRSDEASAKALQPWSERNGARVFRVPDAPWARRFGATLVNRLVRENPACGFAIFQARTEGGYLVSLRSPQQGPRLHWDASHFASDYPTGGGRVQAAGINALPESLFEACAERFLSELSA
jgi:hypothetical protein